jgi:hypothetical protein
MSGKIGTTVEVQIETEDQKEIGIEIKIETEDQKEIGIEIRLEAGDRKEIGIEIRLEAGDQKEIGIEIRIETEDWKEIGIEMEIDPIELSALPEDAVLAETIAAMKAEMVAPLVSALAMVIVTIEDVDLAADEEVQQTFRIF